MTLPYHPHTKSVFADPSGELLLIGNSPTPAVLQFFGESGRGEPVAFLQVESPQSDFGLAGHHSENRYGESQFTTRRGMRYETFGALGNPKYTIMPAQL
jgi:hypothetical protein